MRQPTNTAALRHDLARQADDLASAAYQLAQAVARLPSSAPLPAKVREAAVLLGAVAEELIVVEWDHD